MDGIEAFTELRRIREDIPIILCSGYNEQDAISHFAGKGLAGFLQKPYNIKALVEILRKVTSH
jgi:CheY-like chemotaxis protein